MRKLGMKIITYPNPFLESVAQPVVSFDGIASFVDEMAQLMYLGNGVGLAAPQVGDLRQILLIDPSGGDRALEFRAMVNPIIEFKSSDMLVDSEGCLSLPGLRIDVPRSTSVVVKYFDLDGSGKRESFTGFPARIVQHELDHLNGITLRKKLRI
jgi:peptide deformylase